MTLELMDPNRTESEWFFSSPGVHAWVIRIVLMMVHSWAFRKGWLKPNRMESLLKKAENKIGISPQA